MVVFLRKIFVAEVAISGRVMQPNRRPTAPATLCFALYAVCHAFLAILQWWYGGFDSYGSVIVIAIAIALVWDNGLLALGSTLFPEAANSRSRDFAKLVALSQPRFFAHALLTPLLALQATRLGQRAGVTWLATGSTAERAVGLIACCLSIFGTMHHARHQSLVLKRPHPKEPKGSWMRSIVSATLAETPPITLAWMIGPAVLVCLWTMCVGISIARVYGELRELAAITTHFHGPLGDVAGRWLWVCALIELLSNAGPPWVMALTGNAGEVVLLAGFVAAERELTAQGFR